MAMSVPAAAHAVVSRCVKAAAPIRRRPTPQQGRALEALGHAIEYLVDSQLHRGLLEVSVGHPEGDTEAAQILMRLNREVFAECAECVPVGRVLKLWLLRAVSAVPDRRF